jgi:hypothetical protein
VYGPSEFSVNVTANAVLTNGTSAAVQTYSVWFGQTYNAVGQNRDYNFFAANDPDPNRRPPIITNLGQVGGLQTEFSTADFQSLFHANHSSSSVSVHSLICIVYIISRDLSNFERDRTTSGRSIVRLF